MSFRDAVISVCTVSLRRLESHPIPQRPWFLLRFRDDQNLTVSESTRAYPAGLISTLDLDFDPRIDPVKHALTADEELAKHLLVDAAGNALSEPAKNGWLWFRFVRPLISAYVRQTGSFAVNQDELRKLLQEAIAESVSPKIRVRLRTPLLNCSIGPDVVNITDGLVIRKASESEIEEWSNRTFLGQGIGHEIHDIRTLIECVQDRPRFNNVEEQKYAAKSIGQLVTAIRVQTGAFVWPLFTEESPESVLHTMQARTLTQTSRPIGPRCQITLDVGGAIRSVWTQMREGTNAAYVALGLRRWDLALIRYDAEDRVLDYWIALESIFNDGASTELKYRVSLRIAEFLAASSDERRDIFALMRKSYDLRSTIAHGRQPKAVVLAEIEAKTREHLRRSLVKILECEAKFSPEELDERLIGR